MAHLLGLRSHGFNDESIWSKLVEADGARLMERLRQTEFSADPILLNFVSSDNVPRTLECYFALMSGGRFVIVGVPARASGEDDDAEWLKLNNAFATLSRENARKSKQLEIQNIELATTTEDLKRANGALTEARTAALQAARATSEFLRNMSHEIRTPMNGVMGMLQLLLETDLSAEQRRYASISEASGRTLLALINDILDLSKIEARKVVLENLKFDLRRTVEDVVQLLGVLARAKGLDIRSRVSEKIPPTLFGDASRLRQVLTNLSGNAIKFTERGEVALDAALESQEDGKATVRFAVTDTGIGVRPDQARTLFAPFAQADTSITRRYGGTGLGLAISKQLVEMMGGTIGIESQEGKGSTFWFTAVFGTLPGAATSTAEPVASAQGGPLASEGDESVAMERVANATAYEARILIADDNATNQAVALAQMEKLGYKADAVVNGTEALEALRHRRYDLVLMDAEMPTMDGYEATRRIRESGDLRVPIIGMTAHATSGERDKCIAVGMNDFLSKPVDLHDLSAVLAKWLLAAEPAEIRSAELAASAQSSSVFDAEALLKRLMGDRQLAGTIVKGFVGDLPAQLHELRKRFDEADRTGARQQAHILKGSAATVSADGLRAIAQEMEQAAAAGHLSHFGELLPRVVEEFARLRGTLENAGWL
jgi:signal transduction histidine kinase/DNA-binding NarL/FixJ family response regulator